MDTINIEVGKSIRKFVVVMDKALHDEIEQAAKVYVVEGDLWPKFLPREKLALSRQDATLVLGWDDKLSKGLWEPTVRAWGKAWAEGKFDEFFPYWKRFAKYNARLVKEVNAMTLTWGVINNIVVNEHEMKAVSAVAMMQMSGLDSASLLRSFHSEAGMARESLAWLFAPAEVSHLTPMARHCRAMRGAMGRIILASGEWQFSKLPADQLGKACELVHKANIGAVIHDKARYVFALAWRVPGTEDEWFFVPGAGSKAHKVVARGQLVQANTCRLPNEVASKVVIDGQPAATGLPFRVLLADGIPEVYDGGFLLRNGLTVRVYEQRVLRMQIPPETEPEIKAGQMVKQGDSLVGIKDIAPAKFDSIITSVDVLKDRRVCTVTVKYDIEVDSKNPKLRAVGYKGSGHYDLDGIMPAGVDVWATPKNKAQLVSMWANTTGEVVDFKRGEAGMPADQLKRFHEWVEQNTRWFAACWQVSPEVADVLEKQGVEITRLSTGIKAWRVFTGVVGQDVLEVESPVTELRLVHTALTPITALEAEQLVKQDFEPVATPIFGLPTERLTMEDAQAALDLSFGEACDFLAKKYPKGMWISNGHRYVADKGGNVEPAEIAVDALAIKMFSAGNINAEDAVGIAFWQVLHDKANFGLLVDQFEDGAASIKDLAQCAEILGPSINFLRGAINGLAVSGAVLKRLSTGRRSAMLGTARAYDRVPVDEVWMSKATAKECHLCNKTGVLVGRHPTPLFYKAHVVIHDELPFGIFAVSSLAMAVSNKGDVDGDQIWLARTASIGNMYQANTRARELASRLICMMAWNAGVEVKATNGDEFKSRKYPAIKFRDLWDRAVENYTRHVGIEGSTYADAYKLPDFDTKFVWKEGDGRFKFDYFTKLAPFGTTGIGIVYAISHNAHVLSCYCSTPKERAAFRAAFVLAQDMYEDIFLAGYSAEHYEVFKALEQPASEGEIGDRVAQLLTALAHNGMKVRFHGVAATTVAKALLIARNMQAGFRNPWVHLFGYERALPVCKAIRGLASGDKSLIVTEEEWNAVIDLTNPACSKVKDNPWWEIIGSIKDVYRLLSKVVAVKSEAAANEVLE